MIRAFKWGTRVLCHDSKYNLYLKNKVVRRHLRSLKDIKEFLLQWRV